MTKMPRQLGLTKIKEQRIIRTLSALPLERPDISIRLLPDQDTDLALYQDSQFPLPHLVGAQGYYADYDPITGRLREATLVWNRRCVRSRRRTYIDRYETGGAWNVDNIGRFQICWHSRCLRRETKNALSLLNEFTGTETLSQLVRVADGYVQWEDEEHCSGPQDGGVLFSGHAEITVGSHVLDCVRTIVALPEDPDDYEGEPYVKWTMLDDSYWQPDGRLALTRRFVTADQYHMINWLDELPPWDEWSPDRAKMLYNGVEFRHYFDMLTDVSLGWPVRQPRLVS